MLVVVVALFTAVRYVSRGFRMQELMVLAGVGSFLFWMAEFLRCGWVGGDPLEQ